MPDNASPLALVPQPPGFHLADYASDVSNETYERDLKTWSQEWHDEEFKVECIEYLKALKVERIKDREERLSKYLLKPPETWVAQRMMFPGPSYLPNFYDDWKDYTELVEAALKGEFDHPDAPGQLGPEAIAAYYGAQGAVTQALASQQMEAAG